MLFKFSLYIIVILTSIILYIKYIENNGVFYPEKILDITPDSLSIPFEDIYLTIGDNVKINGWFIPKEQAKHTILFLHGNAGNLGYRLDKIALLRKNPVDIFIIDYRGFGKSNGKPSEKGVYKDAEAAYWYMVNNRGILPESIILYGESIGGAVAVDLASKVKTEALILEGTFSKGRDMAKKILPFIPSFLFSNMFDSLAKIKKITAPVLFIHSKDDETIPFDLALKLYNGAISHKQFVEIKGSHNQGFIDSKVSYSEALKTFIGSL